MSSIQTPEKKDITNVSVNPEVDEASGSVEVVTSNVGFDKKHAVGADLFEELLESDLTEDLDYAKVRRKIDCWLLPVLCVTYMLQFLDKLSLNYASAYNLKEDLKLTGNDYGDIAAIFNAKVTW